ncbi:hypothetical protein KKI17_01680 [Patescibacteria group bacterium]|nr:hypothetical protein [Patescibacteria group bacterium]
MQVHIIKEPITREELKRIAQERYGDLVKAAVDVEKEIMAVGGELHIDEENALIEEEDSKGGHVWGINLYPGESGERFIEFDSVINLKPGLGNRSRDVDNLEIRRKLITIVQKLIQE